MEVLLLPGLGRCSVSELHAVIKRVCADAPQRAGHRAGPAGAAALSPLECDSCPALREHVCRAEQTWVTLVGQPPTPSSFGGPPFHGVLLVKLSSERGGVVFMFASGDVFLSLLSF